MLGVLGLMVPGMKVVAGVFHVERVERWLEGWESRIAIERMRMEWRDQAAAVLAREMDRQILEGIRCGGLIEPEVEGEGENAAVPEGYWRF
jgi:hypothetical protein